MIFNFLLVQILLFLSINSVTFAVPLEALPSVSKTIAITREKTWNRDLKVNLFLRSCLVFSTLITEVEAVLVLHVRIQTDAI